MAQRRRGERASAGRLERQIPEWNSGSAVPVPSIHEHRKFIVDYETMKNEWLASDVCKALHKVLRKTVFQQNARIDRAICPGLGSLTTGGVKFGREIGNLMALSKLIVFETIIVWLREVGPLEDKDVHFQDPLFNINDKAFLQYYLHHSVVDKNRVFDLMSPETFLFAPCISPESTSAAVDFTSAAALDVVYYCIRSASPALLISRSLELPRHAGLRPEIVNGTKKLRTLDHFANGHPRNQELMYREISRPFYSAHLFHRLLEFNKEFLEQSTPAEWKWLADMWIHYTPDAQESLDTYENRSELPCMCFECQVDAQKRRRTAQKKLDPVDEILKSFGKTPNFDPFLVTTPSQSDTQPPPTPQNGQNNIGQQSEWTRMNHLPPLTQRATTQIEEAFQTPCKTTSRTAAATNLAATSAHTAAAAISVNQSTSIAPDPSNPQTSRPSLWTWEEIEEYSRRLNPISAASKTAAATVPGATDTQSTQNSGTRPAITLTDTNNTTYLQVPASTNPRRNRSTSVANPSNAQGPSKPPTTRAPLWTAEEMAQKSRELNLPVLGSVSNLSKTARGSTDTAAKNTNNNPSAFKTRSQNNEGGLVIPSNIPLPANNTSQNNQHPRPSLNLRTPQHSSLGRGPAGRSLLRGEDNTSHTMSGGLGGSRTGGTTGRFRPRGSTRSAFDRPPPINSTAPPGLFVRAGNSPEVRLLPKSLADDTRPADPPRRPAVPPRPANLAPRPTDPPHPPPPNPLHFIKSSPLLPPLVTIIHILRIPLLIYLFFQQRPLFHIILAAFFISRILLAFFVILDVLDIDEGRRVGVWAIIGVPVIWWIWKWYSARIVWGAFLMVFWGSGRMVWEIGEGGVVDGGVEWIGEVRFMWRLWVDTGYLWLDD